MRQDLDEVILIINYLSESGKASKTSNAARNTTTEKEQDKNFWAAF
jgi:hypothetical protein